MTGLVVDSSALVAMVLGEEGSQDFDDLVAEHESMVSAATLVETSMVIEARTGLAGAFVLDEIVRDGDVEVVDIDEPLARAAVRAWRQFGKGNHPAALNFGDCFVYALAKHRNFPILCRGNDFARTDVPVLPLR